MPMNDYRSTAETLVLSDRMESVHADVLARLKPRNARESTSTAECTPDGRNPFLDVFMENPDAPYVVKLAKAIVRSWMVTPMVIHRGESVVGVTRPRYPMIEHFSWGISGAPGSPGRSNFHVEEGPVDVMRRQALAVAGMTPLDFEHRFRSAWPLVGRDRLDEIYANDIFQAGGYQGHTIPNYVTLLENGLDGMLEKIDRFAAENPVNRKGQDTADFYEANRIIVRGMSEWLTAYADLARRLALEESDACQKRYYEEIAANCAFVAHKKPETLYQAVQLMWCLALWDWVDCLGRVDQYLLPYWEKAKREGDVIPPEDAIVSIMFKIWEHGAHNTTISGAKPADGSDATNELSFVFLQVLRRIHDTHPRMVVRIREDVQPALLSLIVKIWSEGMCDPTIVSDSTIIPGLTRIGVPLEDARDYATLGCQEIEIPGQSNTGCEDGHFNIAKVFEIAMLGGKSPAHPDRYVGPATKPFLECESFEELYDGFQKQIEYFTQIFTYICDRGQEERAANHAKLVKGVFTTGVLESGVNHDDGGTKYNYGVVETAGVAATADSFTAIQKLVFEEKRITKERLMEALAANFEGFEKERQLLLNRAPKFGNDSDEADTMAARVLNTFWDECAKYKSVRGDVFTGACSLLMHGITYGQTMGAMPDGRFAGEALGNTMGPRPGADTNGVTAMLKSVAKLPLYKGIGGTTLNVILTTKMLATPELRENIAAAIKVFMNSGGNMAQITTANLEDLLDAKVHPERHGNLIVRVGGFSIQFVQLDHATQDEIISRYTA